MATASFTKKFRITEPKEVERFERILYETPLNPIGDDVKKLASEENMNAGRERLKKWVSTLSP
jgi:hypothetical protein